MPRTIEIPLLTVIVELKMKKRIQNVDRPRKMSRCVSRRNCLVVSEARGGILDVVLEALRMNVHAVVFGEQIGGRRNVSFYRGESGDRNRRL